MTDCSSLFDSCMQFFAESLFPMAVSTSTIFQLIAKIDPKYSNSKYNVNKTVNDFIGNIVRLILPSSKTGLMQEKAQICDFSGVLIPWRRSRFAAM